MKAPKTLIRRLECSSLSIKKRNHQMTAFGKAYNHLLSVLRIPVEHHFARLQKFGCLAGLWRGPQTQHEDVFCIVGGLLNFRATGKFDLA